NRFQRLEPRVVGKVRTTRLLRGNRLQQFFNQFVHTSLFDEPLRSDSGGLGSGISPAGKASITSIYNFIFEFCDPILSLVQEAGFLVTFLHRIEFAENIFFIVYSQPSER